MLLRIKLRIFYSIVLLFLLLGSLRLHFRFAGRLQDFVGDVLSSLFGRREVREEWLCTFLETCGTTPRPRWWCSCVSLWLEYNMYVCNLYCSSDEQLKHMCICKCRHNSCFPFRIYLRAINLAHNSCFTRVFASRHRYLCWNAFTCLFSIRTKRWLITLADIIFAPTCKLLALIILATLDCRRCTEST